MREIKLLPCPFCGGKAEFDDIHNPAVNKIICTKCGMHTGLHLTSKRGVAQIWNTRRPMERIVERLRKASCYVEDGDGHAGHFVFTDEAIEIVKEEGGLYDSTRSD